VAIDFGSDDFTSVYDWAAGEGWKRSTPSDGPFVAEGEGGATEQVTVTNVVVVWVADQSAEATTGEGEALVLRDGSLVTGRWQRADVSSPWTFVDAAGEPLPLAPGITWVHLAVTGNTEVAPCPPTNVGEQ
jgi:hypothetical protein